jgi:hypothetical protein
MEKTVRMATLSSAMLHLTQPIYISLSQMERGMAEPQEALGRAAQSLRDEIADDSL